MSTPTISTQTKRGCNTEDICGIPSTQPEPLSNLVPNPQVCQGNAGIGDGPGVNYMQIFRICRYM
eukprot:90078-Amorphochlora_amoeboformis.AAC.1